MTENVKTALNQRIKEDYANTAGMMIMQEGKVIYENYFNGCSPDSTLHVYSVTKSIISVLFGIALDQKRFTSIDQHILEFFPDYTPAKEETGIQSVTIRDMLTMTAPYKHQEEPYMEYFTSDDWTRFSLDLLGGTAPKEFRYTPLVGPDILSAILTRITGQSVLNYAREVLFGPLSITVKDCLVFQSAEEQFAFNASVDISGWVTDPKGIHSGGWGLTLSLRDMAKIGQLYLNKGIWGKKQIVSESCITESTRKQSSWNDLAYGCMWWVISDHSFAAMGDGGNVIYMDSKKQRVIAITSLFVPEAKDRLDFIQEFVEPLLNKEI